MSWKKYGGLKNLDSNNNIAVNTLVTDTFTIRDKLLTEFQVTGDTQLLGDVLLGILDLSNNVTKTVTSNAHIIATGNVDISGNTSVGGKLFLTPSKEGIFIKGTDSGKLGINTSSPTAILDISGSYEEILNVQSQLLSNRNIIARNNTDDGIAIVTTDVSSAIQFYNGGDITDKLNPNAEIKYTNNGILEIITDTDTRIFSSITISDDGRSGHLNNETMVIYDISDGTYRNLYYKDGTIRKGNAITVVSSDASSNTSIHIITPSGEGGTIIGGAYPGDLTKSMLIMDVSNNSQIKAPAQMIVAGTNLEKYNTTTSFNKFISQVDKYVVDINGATNITDNQTNIMEEPAKEILKMGFHGDHGYAIGSIDSDIKHMLYKTLNGGITWTQVEFTYGVPSVFLYGDKYSFNDIHINENTLSLVVIFNGESSFLFTTPNKTEFSDTYGIFNPHSKIAYTGAEVECVYGFTDTYLLNHFVVARATSIILVNSDNGIDELTYNNTNQVKDIDGFSNVIFCVGEDFITKYTLNTQLNTTTPPNAYGNIASVAFASNPAYNSTINNINYKTVSVYNAMLAIAAGESGLSYTKDGGATWTDVSIPNLNPNNIFIKSELHAIVVGNGGNIYVTQDGCKTWNKADDLYFNGSGISNFVLTDTSNNITSVYMPNDNTILTSHVNKQMAFNVDGTVASYGESKLIHTHTPSLFNRNNTSVLDVVGTISVSGDIMFHDRGELKTTDASFGLLKTGTTEINFGLSGETITMGSKTGLVDMNGRLQVADDVSMNSNLDVSGNTTMVGLLDVSSDVHFRSQLNVDGSANFTENLNISGDIILSNNAGIVTTDTTFGLLETVAKTINFGLAGETINIGSKTGLVDISGRLQVADDVSLNSNLDVSGNTTMVGLLDVSSDVHFRSQLNVDGLVNFTENLNISGDIILSNNAGIVTTDTTFGLLETVATTINFGLEGSTINVGASVSNVILNDKLNVKGDTLVNGSLTVDGSINFVGLVQTDICHNVLVSDQLRINNLTGTDIAFDVNQMMDNKIADFKKADVSKFYIESSGKVVATEDVSFNKLLTSGGDVHIASVTVASSGGQDAALYVEGGTKMVKPVYAVSDVYIGGTLYVTGDVVALSEQQIGSLGVLQTATFFDEGQAQLSGAPVDICGGALIHQNLIVKKNIETLESVISGGDISGGTQFYLMGDASMNSNLFVSGDISANSGLSIGMDASMNSNLFVSGDISANSGLSIGMDASMNSNLFVSGDASMNSNLFVSGDASMNSNLFVSGDASMNSNLFVSGDASMNSNLFVKGEISGDNGGVSIANNANIGGMLTSVGDISGNSNLFVGGDASLNSALFVSGNIGINKAPSSSLAIDIASTTAIQLPMGTNAERNNYASDTGQIRYNTDTTKFEGKNSGGWGSLGGVSNNDESTIINVDDSENLSFQTNSIQHMSIIQNGDVSMNSKLNINGDININGVITTDNKEVLNANSTAIRINEHNAWALTKIYNKVTIDGLSDKIALDVSSNYAMKIPVGNDDNREDIVVEDGLIRYNTSDNTFEGYGNSAWGSLGGVTSVDKSSQVYIDATNGIILKTDGKTRGEIKNNGQTTFNVESTDGSGNINMYQSGSATFLDVKDICNNNTFTLQNQGAMKIIYTESGKLDNAIELSGNEITHMPQYPIRTTMTNRNGSLTGDDAGMHDMIRDKTWDKILDVGTGVRTNGHRFGNTVTLSLDGTRMAIGQHGGTVGKFFVYNIGEKGCSFLLSEVLSGKLNSLSMNEDGSRIMAGMSNINSDQGSVEIYDITNYAITSKGTVTGIEGDSTSGSQFGHTTSMNNAGTIFAAGQYTTNTPDPVSTASSYDSSMEGGVSIFSISGDSIATMAKISDISMNGDTNTSYVQMGRSIEIDGTGDRLLVGGTINTVTSTSIYEVYIYHRQSTSGPYEKKLTVTQQTDISGVNFGISVALSNDGKVMAIATQEKNGVDETGQVIVYDISGTGIGAGLEYSQRGGVIELASINNMDTFGASMSLNSDGTTIAIAAGSLDSFKGHAYIYKLLNNVWTLVKDVQGTGYENLGGISDHYGVSGNIISDEDGICMDGTGNLVIIGAPNEYVSDGTESTDKNGNAYVYRNQVFSQGVYGKTHMKGNVLIDNGKTGALQGGQLLFDNTLGEPGTNKISLHSNKYGMGVDTDTLKYLTPNTHKFYTNSDVLVNGDARMTILQNGNVGIGVTNPAPTLQIHNTTGLDATDAALLPQYSLAITGANTSANDKELGIAFCYFINNAPDDNDTPGAAITHERTDSSSKGKLHFKTKGGTGGASSCETRMTINEDGNVGIGTTDPTDKLHVVGNTKITGDLIISNFLKATSSTVRILPSLSTKVSWFQFQNSTTTDSTNNIFDFNISDNYNEISTRSLRPLVFQSAASGNMGIGKTNPTEKLEVNGNVKVDNLISSNNASIGMGGNGTHPVEVNGTGSIARHWLSILHNTNNGIAYGEDLMGGILFASAGSNKAFPRSFYMSVTKPTTSVYRMDFGWANNIKTNLAPVDFDEVAYPKAIMPVMSILQTTGNVGIGTTNPTEKLDVVGNIKLTNTTSLTRKPTETRDAHFNSASVSITRHGDKEYVYSSNTPDDTHIIKMGYTDGYTAYTAGGENTFYPDNHAIKFYVHDRLNIGDPAAKIFEIQGGGLCKVYGDLDVTANIGLAGQITTTAGWFDIGVSGSGLTNYLYHDFTLRVNPAGSSLRSALEILSIPPTTATDANLSRLLTFVSPWSGGVKESGGFVFDQDDTGTTSSTIYPRLNIKAIQSTGTTRETNALTLKTTSTTNVNVGIGTTDPTQKLDVNGNVNISGDFVIANNGIRKLGFSDNNGSGERFYIRVDESNVTTISNNDATASMNFYNNAGDYNFTLHDSSNVINYTPLTIKGSNGNVGIGTTNPTEKLHVHDGNIAIKQTMDQEEFPNTATGLVFSRAHADVNITNRRFFIVPDLFSNLSVGSAMGLHIGYNNDNTNNIAGVKMSILADGNVGIGTTNPTEKLEVYDDNIMIKQPAREGNPNGAKGLVFARDDANGLSDRSFYIVPDTWGGTDTTMGLHIGYKLATTITNPSSGIKMSILAGGNVGIGTTEPTANLEVVGKLRVTDTVNTTGAISTPNGLVVTNEGSFGANNVVRLHAFDSVNETQNSAASINAVRIFSYQKQQEVTNLGCKSEMFIGTRCDGNGSINESRCFISYDNNFTIYKHISPALATSGRSSINVTTAQNDPKIGIDDPDPSVGVPIPTAVLTCDSAGDINISGNCDAASFSVPSGNVKTKIRVWGSSDENWGIGMGDHIDHDTVTSHALMFSAGSGGEQGFMWLSQSTPIMSLNSATAHLKINGVCSAASFDATSDIRVKTNIDTIIPITALEKVAQITPKSYKFVDQDRTQYGLIAQDLEKIVPEAVSSNGQHFIPSIYESCLLINGGTTIVLDVKTVSDISGSKLQITDSSGNYKTLQIKDTDANKQIHLDADAREHAVKQEDGTYKIFVFGHNVSDFRSVNYNQLVAINLAATKELNTQLKDTQTQLKDLQTQFDELRELIKTLVK